MLASMSIVGLPSAETVNAVASKALCDATHMQIPKKSLSNTCCSVGSVWTEKFVPKADVAFASLSLSTSDSEESFHCDVRHHAVPVQFITGL